MFCSLRFLIFSGQDSKTLMLFHVSRKEDDLCETICSLNFATRAKNIHLGQDESKVNNLHNKSANFIVLTISDVLKILLTRRKNKRKRRQ